MFMIMGCNKAQETVSNNFIQSEGLHSENIKFAPDVEKKLQALGFIIPSKIEKAPDFSLKSLDGAIRSLSSLRGKVIFLNFWGVWCVYCRQEMPSIQTMYNSLKGPDFEVLAVDVQDSEATVRQYVSANKHDFPVLLDTEFKATQQYGIRGFPTTFIIDREGNLIAKLVGSRDYSYPAVIEAFKALIQ